MLVFLAFTGLLQTDKNETQDHSTLRHLAARSCFCYLNKIICALVLGVHKRQQQLKPCESIGPGVSQGDGAVFGQVLLPQEDVKTQHPRVLHTLGEDPHVAGALHVIGAAHQSSRPLHQPLEVNVVAERQGGLREVGGKGMKHGGSKSHPQDCEMNHLS